MYKLWNQHLKNKGNYIFKPHEVSAELNVISCRSRSLFTLCVMKPSTFIPSFSNTEIRPLDINDNGPIPTDVTGGTSEQLLILSHVESHSKRLLCKKTRALVM